MKIAILITSHNRKNKTLNCLSSLFNAELPSDYTFDVFLVDDGSTDATSETIKDKFPEVNIIQGSGSLYWAGGMRLAWETAIRRNQFDIFLLINDDVVLKKDYLINLIKTDQFTLRTKGKRGIYSGSTIDRKTKKTTYSGSKILHNGFKLQTVKILPTKEPQECDMTNANILWVSREVVDKIGILDKKFIHGIADYDYSLSAKKNGFPVYVAIGIGGYCTNEHGVNWKTHQSTLKERITYLMSPTGLQYKEYLYFIRRHFPLSLPYEFTMLWLKTLFPIIWIILK